MARLLFWLACVVASWVFFVGMAVLALRGVLPLAVAAGVLWALYRGRAVVL